MCTESEGFMQYAKAERDLCQKAGMALTDILNEVESRYGIRIAELRVTMDRSHSPNGWPAANCVMVREEQGDAAKVTELERDDRPPSAMIEHSA